MGSNLVYLGSSLIIGWNKSKEFFKLKDWVRGTLEGWNKQLLSKAGKVTLLKFVIQAMPAYSMATFKIPRDSTIAILKLVWPSTTVQVKLLWMGNKEGRFSVSSCYNLKFQGDGSIRKAMVKFENLVDEFFEASCSVQTSKAYSNGKAGIALVARDSNGKIMSLASKTIQCDPPCEAELQAIYWASAYAEDKGWDLIEWSSDSKMVVKEVADQSAPPRSWFIYFEMMRGSSKFPKVQVVY
ncbi:hypothetical protein FEM48_Zijuj03G0202200 [Ziziphus jujuba var. spinosa]|uniref:RNase H type-1 domain-containing protein n=1 Tax=Ziziphus jujuba var. spinosa TaxID=714518 RepID=A0A978VSE0_ZIZJJ|nr:hypothetical protein FEM48_Zijuj03G0202200 [Ziziphus jujuba var. spinosa]